MLKEVIVFETGIPFFHYSSDPSKTSSDKAILSSGFLSAIKDFSESTRDDIVDSFTTETEYFLFIRFQETTKVIVGIFTRDVLETQARKFMKVLHSLISNSEIRNEKLPILNTPGKMILTEQIAALAAQRFGTESDAAYMENILQLQTYISIAFLIDVKKKRKVAHFARPQPLFREGQVNEFLLVFSNLRQTLSKLEISNEFSYLVLKSEEYVIASCWSGNNLSVASGAPQIPEKDVLDITAQICHHSSIDSLVRLSDEKKTVTRSILLNDGKLDHEEGTIFPSIAGVFFSSLINNLNRFFKILSRRNFIEFKVVAISADNIVKKLLITRKGSSDEFIIELIHYI